MSKKHKPETAVHGSNPRWRPSVTPADYNDEVSDEHIEALHEIVSKEAKNQGEVLLLDGPAW